MERENEWRWIKSFCLFLKTKCAECRRHSAINDKFNVENHRKIEHTVDIDAMMMNEMKKRNALAKRTKH